MAKEWGYASHNGPDHWHEIYPIAKGDNQSPIELHTKDIKHDPSLLPWSASYDPGSCKTILNNGKTCRVVFDDTFDRSMLRGGPLTGPYRLRQFHLHWGSSDDHGSEHTMAKLRSLLSSAENEPPVPLVGNWRPPQPIKGRVVRASFK
ncbi:carbonic anhydrase 3 [Rhinolophus ferrumequinum]|uniref:carbonic anhydrase n=1 Tax=Rhinolophus ferrumequinum TaxID=59479 RepID=A0A7J7VDF6_RHIFE|nr:carbonic anhydrase 3 [Rhinolophus ferrumequinum]